ncbi:MAG: FHA domain-containing protein [bacterium]|nr:FHA domain-containing protein [bacterium]
MLEVILTYPTPAGSQEIPIDRERTSFGRGTDATHRFDDNSLSRLHATVYRDGDRVWIVDENSANGTFVNGQPTASAGTPLRDGDTIKIGNETYLKVYFRQPAQQATPAPQAAAAASGGNGVAGVEVETSGSGSSHVSIIAISLVGLAFVVIALAGVFVAYRVLARNEVEIADDIEDDPVVTTTKNRDKDDKPTPTPGTSSTGTTTTETPLPNTADPKTQPTGYIMPPGKKYLDLSDSEKRAYLGDRARKMAQVIGNLTSDEVPAAALDKIKGFTDGYAKRANVGRKTGTCGFADNLQATYERASKNAPFIVKAFNEKGTDPRIGLYLAMIESEHCVCLQSPTGPLGMFQFTQATGKAHGLDTKPGASPSNPDERCEPEPSARAAASYMKSLLGRYGTGPASVPLAIGSYNSGEGGLSSNLVKALESDGGLPRDFWTLIANGDKLSKQFQSENFKYVPKFFAAAIIGEFPQDFGLKLQPLSTYSK